LRRAEKSKPDGCGKRLNQQGLLKEVLRQGKDHVTAFGTDVVHELEEGPLIVNIPEQVGQENQEGCAAAQPDPAIEEDAALGGEQKADDHAEAKQCDGIFFLEANARDHAEPEPVVWIIALDGEEGEVGAAHPESGFEAVGAEQAGVR
jgi:hypothetical protein